MYILDEALHVLVCVSYLCVCVVIVCVCVCLLGWLVAVCAKLLSHCSLFYHCSSMFVVLSSIVHVCSLMKPTWLPLHAESLKLHAGKLMCHDFFATMCACVWTGLTEFEDIQTYWSTLLHCNTHTYTQVHPDSTWFFARGNMECQVLMNPYSYSLRQIRYAAFPPLLRQTCSTRIQD